MTTIEKKQCKKCEQMKDVAEFNKSTRNGYQYYCRDCEKQRRKEYTQTFQRKASSAARSARKKAKLCGAEDTLTLEEVRAILSNEHCSYCHSEVPEMKRTIDHVHAMNEGGANTFDNVVMACHTCNAAKHSKPAYDFIMKKAHRDATRGLLETLSERMDVHPIEALRVLEAQQTAFCEAQWRAKHYPEVDAQ